MKLDEITEVGTGDHIINERTGRRGVVIALDPANGRVRVRARCSASKDILTKWDIKHCRLLAYR